MPEYLSVIEEHVQDSRSSPSILNYQQANRIQDILIRARQGIKIGEIQKEAHMAYAMAIQQQKMGNFIVATRFLKRLFLCSKLLEDNQGTAISLNLIGICYYRAGQFDKSLVFHKKHLEVIDT